MHILFTNEYHRNKQTKISNEKMRNCLHITTHGKCLFKMYKKKIKKKDLFLVKNKPHVKWSSSYEKLSLRISSSGHLLHIKHTNHSSGIGYLNKTNELGMK